MVSSEYFSALTKEEKDEYILKLTNVGFSNEEDDPFILDGSLSKEIWSFPVESWPEVEFGNVYVYLLELSGCAAKSVKAYKTSDAYKCFANGFVHRLAIRQSLTGNTIIRARVKRSENATEEPHRTWVGLNNEDGSIITGHCTCMKGSSALCTHVSATVFQMEAASRQGYQEKACACCSPLPNDGNDAQEVIQVVVHQDRSASEQTDHGSKMEPTITVVASKGDFPMISVNLKDLHYCKMCNMGFTASHLLENHMEQDHKADLLMVKEESGEAQDEEESFSEDVTAMESNLQGLNDPDGLLLSATPIVVLEPIFRSERELHDMREKLMALKASGENSTVTKQKSSFEIAKTSADVDPSFRCEECGMKFEFRCRLRRHLKMHTREKQVKDGTKAHNCEECGKGFKRHHDLKRHMVTHTRNFTQAGSSSNKPDVYGKVLENAENASRFPGRIIIHRDQNPFQYTECNKEMKQKNDLITHMKIHTAQKVCEGEESKESSNHISDLTVDEPPDGSSHTCFRRFGCGLCGNSFVFRSYLKIHFMRKHSGKESYQCGKCKEKFDGGNELKEHIKTSHTELNSCVCRACGIDFKTRSAFALHQNEHLNKSYKCKECGTSFSHKYLLQQHFKSHRPPLKCDKCGKKVASTFHLRMHMRMHDEKTHECLQCGRRFRLKSELEFHAQMHVKDKLFMCDECGKSFNRLRSLKSHMQRHTLGKPHECEECGIKFQELGNLRRHKRIHTGEKPYLCSQCGKGFNQKGNLKLHFNSMHAEDKKPKRKTPIDPRRIRLHHLSPFATTHLGKRYFQCDKCDDKKFKTRSMLRDHMRMHTGEKPFQCQTCGMAFQWSSNYTRHLKIHTGEKPYTCKVCGKTFRQIDNLHVHTRSHTGEKPFTCSVCDRSFSDRRGLRRHEGKHAPETSDSATAISVPSERIESVEKIEGIASVEIIEIIDSVENMERIDSVEIMERIKSVENMEMIKSDKST